MVAHAYGANDDLFQTFNVMKPVCIVGHSFTVVIMAINTAPRQCLRKGFQ